MPHQPVLHSGELKTSSHPHGEFIDLTWCHPRYLSRPLWGLYQASSPHYPLIRVSNGVRAMFGQMGVAPTLLVIPVMESPYLAKGRGQSPSGDLGYRTG